MREQIGSDRLLRELRTAVFNLHKLYWIIIANSSNNAYLKNLSVLISEKLISLHEFPDCARPTMMRKSMDEIKAIEKLLVYFACIKVDITEKKYTEKLCSESNQWIIMKNKLQKSSEATKETIDEINRFFQIFDTDKAPAIHLQTAGTHLSITLNNFCVSAGEYLTKLTSVLSLAQPPDSETKKSDFQYYKKKFSLSFLLLICKLCILTEQLESQAETARALGKNTAVYAFKHPLSLSTRDTTPLSFFSEDALRIGIRQLLARRHTEQNGEMIEREKMALEDKEFDESERLSNSGTPSCSSR